MKIRPGLAKSESAQSRCSSPVSALRAGLTLLEILLASTILAVAMAALAQQNANGVRAAMRTQLETDAAVLCQSQLSRLLTEGLPHPGASEFPFPHDGRWRWMVDVQPSTVPELQQLTVTVYQEGHHRSVSSFSLSRLVPLSWNRKAAQ